MIAVADVTDAQIDALVAAARALAAMGAPEVEHRTDYDASDLRCALCGVSVGEKESVDLGAPENHTDTCPWRMARVAVTTDPAAPAPS